MQLLLAGLCYHFRLSGKLPFIAALGTGSLSARKAASAFISLAPGPPDPRPVSNIWFIIASPCALRKLLIHLQRLCFQVTLHGHILVSVQVVPSPPSLLIDPERYLLSSCPPTSVKGFFLAG